MMASPSLLTRARGIPAWTAWLVSALLVLQAAVPLLATWSAQLRGVTVVEVCSVYGMQTIAYDDNGPIDHLPAPQDTQAHGSQHCALASLLVAALDQPLPAAVHLHAPAPRAIATPARPTLPPDADRIWQSARKQGPPLTA